MSYWSYKCPYCDEKIKTERDKDFVKTLIGYLVFCPKCLNILKINDDLTVSNFQQECLDNSKKRKAESKLNEPDKVEVYTI